MFISQRPTVATANPTYYFIAQAGGDKNSRGIAKVGFRPKPQVLQELTNSPASSIFLAFSRKPLWAVSLEEPPRPLSRLTTNSLPWVSKRTVSIEELSKRLAWIAEDKSLCTNQRFKSDPRRRFRSLRSIRAKKIRHAPWTDILFIHYRCSHIHTKEQSREKKNERIIENEKKKL